MPSSLPVTGMSRPQELYQELHADPGEATDKEVSCLAGRVSLGLSGNQDTNLWHVRQLLWGDFSAIAADTSLTNTSQIQLLLAFLASGWEPKSSEPGRIKSTLPENKKTYGLLSSGLSSLVLYVPTTGSVERISKTFSLSGLESEVAQSCQTLCNPKDSSLHQAPPSMGFSRQEYWSGLPFPSPRNLPNPGIEPRSPAL